MRTAVAEFFWKNDLAAADVKSSHPLKNCCGNRGRVGGDGIAVFAPMPLSSEWLSWSSPMQGER
jgi:hypothetical protein